MKTVITILIGLALLNSGQAGLEDLLAAGKKDKKPVMAILPSRASAEFTSKEKVVMIEDLGGLDHSLTAYVERMLGILASNPSKRNVLIINHDGRLFAQLFLEESELNSEETMRKIKEHADKGMQFLEVLSAANGLSGSEKRDKLKAALEMIPIELAIAGYQDYVKELIKFDPEGKDPVTSKFKVASQKAELSSQRSSWHYALTKELGKLPQNAHLDDQLKVVDHFIESNKLDGENKQVMLMRKYLLLLAYKKYDETLALLDEIQKLHSDTPLAGRIPYFKENVRKMKTASETQPNAPQAQGQ